MLKRNERKEEGSLGELRRALSLRIWDSHPTLKYCTKSLQQSSRDTSVQGDDLHSLTVLRRRHMTLKNFKNEFSCYVIIILQGIVRASVVQVSSNDVEKKCVS